MDCKSWVAAGDAERPIVSFALATGALWSSPEVAPVAGSSLVELPLMMETLADTGCYHLQLPPRNGAADYGRERSRLDSCRASCGWAGPRAEAAPVEAFAAWCFLFNSQLPFSLKPTISLVRCSQYKTMNNNNNLSNGNLCCSPAKSSWLLFTFGRFTYL